MENWAWGSAVAVWVWENVGKLMYIAAHLVVREKELGLQCGSKIH